MDFFQAIYDWFQVDLYNFVTETIEYLLLKLVWFRIKFSIWISGIVWSVARALLVDLNVANLLANAVSSISPQNQGLLEFFNIFSGMQLTLQSLAAKFVMKVINRS